MEENSINYGKKLLCKQLLIEDMLVGDLSGACVELPTTSLSFHVFIFPSPVFIELSLSLSVATPLSISVRVSLSVSSLMRLCD